MFSDFQIEFELQLDLVIPVNPSKPQENNTTGTAITKKTVESFPFAKSVNQSVFSKEEKAICCTAHMHSPSSYRVDEEDEKPVLISSDSW